MASRSRKPAAPAREPLPSLDELQAAFDRRWKAYRAECRASHRHDAAGQAACDRKVEPDPRRHEFVRRAAFFLHTHPGATMHDPEFQHELDHIAGDLRLQPPDATHFVAVYIGGKRFRRYTFPALDVFVTKLVGISPDSSFSESQKQRARASAGRPVPMDVTNIVTGEIKRIWSPLRDIATRTSGRAGRTRKVSLEAFLADVDQYPGSDQSGRAKRLHISTRTVRTYMQQLGRPQSPSSS